MKNECYLKIIRAFDFILESEQEHIKYGNMAQYGLSI